MTKQIKRQEREAAESTLERLECAAFQEGFKIGELIALASSIYDYTRGYIVHADEGRYSIYSEPDEKESFDRTMAKLKSFAQREHLDSGFREYLLDYVERSQGQFNCFYHRAMVIDKKEKERQEKERKK
jgi:hypothetical protein